MDAKQWNGPDERNLDPDYEAGSCDECGAGPDEPCEQLCGCAVCVYRRTRPDRWREDAQPEVVSE